MMLITSALHLIVSRQIMLLLKSDERCKKKSLSQLHSLNPVVANDDEKILKGIIDVSSKSTAIGIPVLTINKSIVTIMNKKVCH